jgi:hypothetical protein
MNSWKYSDRCEESTYFMTGLTFWIEDRAKCNRGFLCNISVDILFDKTFLTKDLFWRLSTDKDVSRIGCTYLQSNTFWTSF